MRAGESATPLLTKKFIDKVQNGNKQNPPGKNLRALEYRSITGKKHENEIMEIHHGCQGKKHFVHLFTAIQQHDYPGHKNYQIVREIKKVHHLVSK